VEQCPPVVVVEGALVELPELLLHAPARVTPTSIKTRDEIDIRQS
jgi:hypothetical protein